MYTIAYFSYTGNTKFMANKLKSSLDEVGAEVVDITSIDPKDIKKNNHLVIMFSIHAFNASKEVIKFVEMLPKAMFDYVSIIAVGCNDMWINDAASLIIRKSLISKGYKIAIDRVIAMPLTFIKDFPEDIKKETIINAQKKIELVAKDLKSNVVDEKEIPTKSKLLMNVGRAEKYAAGLFGLELHANKDCISCGHCWSSCPSKNIKEKNKKPKFGIKCSMCMKCIYECPTHAISPRISKFMPIKGGYSITNYVKNNKL